MTSLFRVKLGQLTFRTNKRSFIKKKDCVTHWDQNSSGAALFAVKDENWKFQEITKHFKHNKRT